MSSLVRGLCRICLHSRSVMTKNYPVCWVRHSMVRTKATTTSAAGGKGSKKSTSVQKRISAPSTTYLPRENQRPLETKRADADCEKCKCKIMHRCSDPVDRALCALAFWSALGLLWWGRNLPFAHVAPAPGNGPVCQQYYSVCVVEDDTL